QASYGTKQGLSTLTQGGGIFRDKNSQQVYIKLDNNQNPQTISGGFTVGTHEAITCISTSSFITISGLSIKNAGWAGVYIRGGELSHHITIQNCTITNCFRGITTDKKSISNIYENVLPYTILIRDNHITNAVRLGNPGSGKEWTRKFAYDTILGGNNEEEYAPMRNKGIFLCGANMDVYNNYLQGHFDGMGFQGTNTRIHHNTFDLISDDGIELESSISADVQFYANYLKNVFTGISLVSQSPGHILIYRNIIEGTRYDPIDKFGPCIKMGKNWSCKAENVKICHNTLYGGKFSIWELTSTIPGKDDAFYTSTCPFIQGSQSITTNDQWQGFQFINNIFCVHDSQTLSSDGYPTTNGGINYNFRGTITNP
ncbi:MAG: right-handed parallel beta-helix repeat-containing protein, partial [Cytophagales bacterium]|nr:right-handed parallel beta-helix repeat-containing protein [Cytophagales bacterium]